MQPKDLKNSGDSWEIQKDLTMCQKWWQWQIQFIFIRENKNNVFTFYDLIKAIITFIQLVIPGRGMSMKS